MLFCKQGVAFCNLLSRRHFCEQSTTNSVSFWKHTISRRTGCLTKEKASERYLTNVYTGGLRLEVQPVTLRYPVHVHSYVKTLLSLSKPLDWRVYEESPNRLCFLAFQILQLLRSQSFQIHWGLKNEFLSGGACPLRPRFNKIRFVDVSLNVSINVIYIFFLIWVGDCSPNLGCNLSWYCLR